jgi:putative sugar O-methyltransferase
VDEESVSVNSVVRNAGLRLLPRSVKDPILRFRRSEPRYRLLLQRFHIEDEGALFERRASDAPVPDDAREYLRPDNPRLAELVHRYQAFDHPISAHSQWTDDYLSRNLDLTGFRGDQPYVWQLRDLNTEINYYVTLSYLKQSAGSVLERLSEDGLFGSHTLTFDGRPVSRDLLDSANEIRFLEATLGLSGRRDFNVLDIGAGYGRLAHRFAEALPPFGRIFCVDAVPVSTFLCEFYLRFRRVDDRASVVPLDELETILSTNHVDLAINIHSFSECSFRAITAWIDLLAEHQIRYLFLVPNPPWPPRGGRDEIDREGLWSIEPKGGAKGGPRSYDYLPHLKARGYRLVHHGPKYDDEAVQRYGVTPAEYYLFELQAV